MLSEKLTTVLRRNLFNKNLRIKDKELLEKVFRKCYTNTWVGKYYELDAFKFRLSETDYYYMLSRGVALYSLGEGDRWHTMCEGEPPVEDDDREDNTWETHKHSFTSVEEYMMHLPSFIRRWHNEQ